MPIYDLVCTAFYETYAPAKIHNNERPSVTHSQGASGGQKEQCFPPDFVRQHCWSAYLRRFAKVQLISHQFRAEFLALWTQQSVFEIPLEQQFFRPQSARGPLEPCFVITGSPSESRIPRMLALISTKTLANRIWIPLRDFVQHSTGAGKLPISGLPSIMDRDIRHVRVRTGYDMCDYHYHSPWELASSLRRFDPQEIASHLEVMDYISSAHPNLQLEVHITCGHAVTSNPNRSMTFRQREPAAVSRRQVEGDWVCVDEGLVMLNQNYQCPQHLRLYEYGACEVDKYVWWEFNSDNCPECHSR